MKFPIGTLLALPLLLSGASIAEGTQFFTAVDPATGQTFMAVAGGAPGAASSGANPLAGLEQQLAGTLSEDVAALLEAMKSDPAAMEAIRLAISSGQTATDAVVVAVVRQLMQSMARGGTQDAKLQEQLVRAQATAQQQAMQQAALARERQQAEQAAMEQARRQALERARQQAEQAALERTQHEGRLIELQREFEWTTALHKAKQGVPSSFWTSRPVWEAARSEAHYYGGANAFLSGGEQVTGDFYLFVDFDTRHVSGEMEFFSELSGGTSLGLEGTASIAVDQNAINGTITWGSDDFDTVFGSTEISRGDWVGAFGGDTASAVGGAWRIGLTDGPNAGVAYGDFFGTVGAD